jgi:hypothetical protein
MWDRVIETDEIVRRYEAGELSLEEIRKNCGHVIVRQILLAKYAVEHEKPWPRLDYPPKMFISHKWRADGTACPQATELAEALARTGVDVIYDKWWTDEKPRDLEWRIAQLAVSRTVFILLTPEYLEHTSITDNVSFKATWVQEELDFIVNLYQHQLEKYGDAIIDPTVLLLAPQGELLLPQGSFNRVFQVNTPESWTQFIASFSKLQVQTLTEDQRSRLHGEARACVDCYLGGNHNEGFSRLAKLAAQFPFVGDLAIMLAGMAHDVGDDEMARQVARIGMEMTRVESWRWEHRWLAAHMAERWPDDGP